MPAEIQSARSDRQLIEACKRGDTHSFRPIYNKYKEKVYSIAYYISGDKEVAKDLAQQIFVKAFTGLHTFRFRSQFSTWLIRLATNVCIDHKRKESRAKMVPIESSPIKNQTSGISADAGLLQAELSGALNKAIVKMSDKLRTVIVLKYVADLSYAEISETLECSIGTVSSRLNRGHRFLARELEHFREDE